MLAVNKVKSCCIDKCMAIDGASISAHVCTCRLSRESYEKLLVAKRKIMEHSNDHRLRKMREISEAAAMARSILHKKVRQHRASLVQPLQPTLTHKRQHKLETNSQRTTDDKHQMEKRSASFLSSSGIEKPMKTFETLKSL